MVAIGGGGRPRRGAWLLEAMVPHHGWVEMAEVLLKRTADAELKKLGQAIIDAQRREIAMMNDFRMKKYGGPVPEMEMD